MPEKTKRKYKSPRVAKNAAASVPARTRIFFFRSFVAGAFIAFCMAKSKILYFYADKRKTGTAAAADPGFFISIRTY